MTGLVQQRCKGYTSPIVIANIHYIMTKLESKEKSLNNIRKLRRMISVLSVTESIIDEALREDPIDFEDSIQYITSAENVMDFIITRNKKNYTNSKVPAVSAREFMAMNLT